MAQQSITCKGTALLGPGTVMDPTSAFLQMQRDTAKENVAEARQNFNAATDAFKAKQDEVEPLQKGRKDQNDLQRNVQAEFRDLEVRSEQELDAKVRQRFISSHGFEVPLQCCLMCAFHGCPQAVR